MEKDLSNHEKLGILFELYEQKLYQVAFSILHNEYDAEDVVADTYEKILQCLGKIGNPNSIATRRFLIKITKNKAIDRYKKIINI